VNTDSIKRIIVAHGLMSAHCTAQPSMCYSRSVRTSSTERYDGGKLGDPTLIEGFTVTAPDGSRFLVQITKLRSEEDA